MKSYKKTRKRILTVATIATIGTSFGLASPNLISADQLKPQKNNLQNEAKLNEEATIVDFLPIIWNAENIVSENDPTGNILIHVAAGANKKMGYPSSKWSIDEIIKAYNVDIRQNTVEADGSPIVTNSDSIFVGTTTLSNNTDQEQTLSTNSFSKLVSNSVTSTTTHGFKLGEKATAKFSIPLVSEASVEVSAEYNFSHADGHTDTTSYTYTASPQNIKVPAHSAVEVIVKLNTVQAKGNVNLFTKLSGTEIFNVIPFNKIIVAASKYQSLANVSANSDGQTINLKGTGTYEAKYGTEFLVTVRPVDKKGNRFKRSTNQEYTYKVNPEIKRNN
ncbi:ETX/MTX2 family pore-forming toxin [Bacillus cereus]|uniref:ETX/MTX2 family pore-forming toxin n=1 Tax=Bacillus thuringiensis TaxID=1428 RepID=UPI0004454462|nr:ETX/MTX2 family pore-forming toxin [Bacillus thuringiensis]MEB8637040.1 ETX/MTX2 family pore-forming toxin [Bacillus cereus]QUW68449.1 ETX/MTX2 family pore-forming toxin [Pseudomonas synxantha]EXY06091.1 sulfurtransferase [Bacillus thuringiensis]MEB8743408.1 ETX/MTX2 family pore-forming toxin [Bacillus cereus]MEB8798708.1 ETX/MTX2 family pore-forming toxin [Bacillus cereus]